jgi:hypothetical protein
MITKETCLKIWNAWNEIDRAKGLINEINDRLEKRGEYNPTPSLRNAFGDNNGLSFGLGIPTSDSGTSFISGVIPELAIKIIEVHISKQEQRLKELSSIAQIELAQY